jgi:hypothetical protein
MIKFYNVSSNQSFFDLSIQIYSIPDYANDIAYLNGYDVISVLPSGTIIKYNDDEKFSSRLEEFNSKIIATDNIRGGIPSSGFLSTFNFGFS